MFFIGALSRLCLQRQLCENENVLKWLLSLRGRRFRLGQTICRLNIPQCLLDRFWRPFFFFFKLKNAALSSLHSSAQSFAALPAHLKAVVSLAAPAASTAAVHEAFEAPPPPQPPPAGSESSPGAQLSSSLPSLLGWDQFLSLRRVTRSEPKHQISSLYVLYSHIIIHSTWVLGDWTDITLMTSEGIIFPHLTNLFRSHSKHYTTVFID